MTYIPANLRRQVLERANYSCEYCLRPSSVSFYPHEVDHIVATKHGGETISENLAYACWRCNWHIRKRLRLFPMSNGLIVSFRLVLLNSLSNPLPQLMRMHYLGLETRRVEINSCRVSSFRRNGLTINGN